MNALEKAREKVKEAETWMNAATEDPVSFGEADEATNAYAAAAMDFFEVYDAAKDKTEIDTVMGGGKPLRERYDDALEVVRKQALAMEELEAINARQRETITALCSASPLFHAVLTASPRYVRRFKGTPTIEGAGRKVEEEYGEFMTAVKNLVAFSSSTHHTATAAALEAEAAKEAVDLMVTIGGLLDAAGVRYDVVDAAAHSTLDKLDNRTDADYVWNPATMTVEKRSKLEAQS